MVAEILLKTTLFQCTKVVLIKSYTQKFIWWYMIRLSSVVMLLHHRPHSTVDLVVQTSHVYFTVQI